MQDERRDYWAAFAIGAVLGVGATLLLKPEPSSAKKILYELETALKRARKRTGRAGRRGLKKVRRTLHKYR
jgi:hypothetical protein